MARQWRIEFENGLYHVMSRGNEQRKIVRDDNDRETFLDVLGRMNARHEVQVYAYVLMDNHYHLLLRTLRGNLSKSMQWFAVSYTRRFNIRHGRNGHLFQGRFKSFVIENDTYLTGVSYYIHRNPLRAGIVKRLADYRWSSYGTYAYGRKAPEWLNTELILSMFQGKEKHRQYRESVQQYAKEDKRIWEDIKHGVVLGGERFIEEIKGRFLEKQQPGIEIPQQKWLLKGEGLGGKLERAARELGLDLEKICKSSRINNKDKEARDLLLYSVWDTGLHTNKEIGEELGLCYSAVSRRVQIMRNRLAKERKLKSRIDKIKSLIKM